MSEKKTSSPVTADARVIVYKAGDGDPIVSNARQLEDDYVSYYSTQESHSLIRPPYDMKRLEEMVQMNNALAPCISCMVTNVAGTGWEIERADGEKMEDADEKVVQPAIDFFNECAPMMSFTTLSKETRYAMETLGNGYMEVIRILKDEIVFIGPMESKMMRIARLQDPVEVEVKMMRGGKEVTFKQYKRERRFAQKVGEQLVWFKEFGASRDLNRSTGEWAKPGQRLPFNLRSTEVLLFTVDPDVATPYGIPRWICQTPSVLGSRKAEEHNLEFFENGGIPPYLVIVQGGQLAEKTVEAVRQALNEKGAHARVQVIEAFSTSGDLNGAANVQVKVERFGAERTNDAMFQQYDKDCELRVRRAFRLPEILLGKTDAMNFATAQAAYLVAEAQVFKPERDEFDERITSTLLPALLDSRDYVFRSKPISIIDADTQLKVLQAAAGTGRVDPENLVTHYGEVGGMEFQTVDVSKVKPAPNFGMYPTGNVVPIETAQPKKVAKSEDDETLIELLNCSLAVLAEHGVKAVAAE
jgi:PBSX family phage portal protein